MGMDELLSALRLHLKGLAELFDDPMLSEALSSAIKELGWTVPTTSSFQQYWLLERAKRACVSMMCLDTAYAFKFKQINLQHRFDHFIELIKEMDKQFELAKKEHPDEFVDDASIAAMTATERISSFGDYHGAGFAYDVAGRSE